MKEGMMEDSVSEIVIYYKLRQDECPNLFANLELSLIHI